MIGHTSTNGSFCLNDQQSEVIDQERYNAAYARFDALMTAQLQELELRFRPFWTPQAKKREVFGRR